MTLEKVELPAMRVIGMQTLGKPADPAFADLWTNKLMPRIKEIARPAETIGFGICRMTENREIEYTAAFQALSDAQVPEGMIEMNIPAGVYLTKTVPSLKDIHAAWAEGMQEFRQQTGGGPKEDLFPPFELYPADFPMGSEKLYIYFPLSRE